MSEVPYFEDNNRKGATRGEAIFGDKHARFEESLTPEGSEQLANADEEQAVHDDQMQRGLDLTPSQQIELEEKSAHGDWDQERIDRAKAAMAAVGTRKQ